MFPESASYFVLKDKDQSEAAVISHVGMSHWFLNVCLSLLHTVNKAKKQMGKFGSVWMFFTKRERTSFKMCFMKESVVLHSWQMLAWLFWLACQMVINIKPAGTSHHSKRSAISPRQIKMNHKAQNHQIKQAL